MLADARPIPDLQNRDTIAFFAITFAISWGIIGSYLIWPETMTSIFGEVSGAHPFFFIATWAPAISAVLLVLRRGGRSGLWRFLGRLRLWRAPRAWWLFILVGTPLVFMAGSLLKGGPLLAPVPPEGVGAVVMLTVVMLFLGPVEELGWRGVAQPLLQRRMAPLWAGVVIGLAWGIWHVPAFFLGGVVFSEWSIMPFLIGNVTLSVIVTAIFNDARGSLLLPALFHWQLILPAWPDAQPWDTAILVVVAAGVVWVRRERMLGRDAAVTVVIPGIEAAPSEEKQAWAF